MTWTVETLGALFDAEIASLPHDMQASFLRLAEWIEAVGLERVGGPHVKTLQGKLWEMQFVGRDRIARAIYVTAVGRRVIVLHAFIKKTQRTPRAALELAMRRVREIKP